MNITEIEDVPIDRGERYIKHLQSKASGTP